MIKLHLTTTLDGILLIDKPIDWTSFDVIRYLRGQFHIAKIGHAGTLDPNATGLLVVLLGKATSYFQTFMGQVKTYEGSIKLGEESTTYDSEGDLTPYGPTEGLTKEAIQGAMDEFLGDQYQMPPMFSAKKIHGVPLYKLARKGKEVERKPSFITIHRFQCLDLANDELTFSVQCSKGTYVRTLAFDLGRKLGCGAYLKSLRRTKSGAFSIDQAVPLKSLEGKDLMDLKALLRPYETSVSPLSAP